LYLFTATAFGIKEQVCRTAAGCSALEEKASLYGVEHMSYWVSSGGSSNIIKPAWWTELGSGQASVHTRQYLPGTYTIIVAGLTKHAC
jgi:hypothetical protein